ncbi:MAG TPA: cation:proton antiporter [Caulobacterales bacterium]|nr:cation:proton antiporter [Caulobacterales bacterium]
MEQYTLITTLVAAIVLAFLFGALAQRFRFSPIFGYLMAGLAVGPNTPGFHADVHLALELSEIGVILLMFGVGLKISLEDIWSVRGVAIPCGVIHTLFAGALGFVGALVLKMPVIEAALVGVALSVASTIVLMRALEERRMVKTAEGRIVVSWLLIEDLLIVLSIVAAPAIIAAISGENTEVSPLRILSAVGLTFAKIGLFIGLMLLIGARLFPWLIIQVAHLKSRELLSLGTLALALGVAYVAFRWFDASFALGAFLAGVSLNGTKFSHRVAEDSLPLRDTFAVLFFVAVGMLFDPFVIVRQPVAVATLVGVIVLGKAIGAYGLMRTFGQAHAASLLVGLGLAQIGEFSFVLAGIGRTLNVVSPETYNLILAGALISIAINPFLMRLASPPAPLATAPVT